MIALIKIRGKYLSNHRCSVYWSYFFFPCIILIFFFLLLLEEGSIRFYKIKGFYFGNLNITNALLSNDIKFRKYNFSLVSNDEKDKKIIQEIVKSDIEWSNQVSGIKKNNNIIKIINKNERYKIEFIINNKDNSIFSEYSIKSFLYSDPFKSPNNPNSHFFWFQSGDLINFIELQSLIAQFLIKKKGFSYLQKDLIQNY